MAAEWGQAKSEAAQAKAVGDKNKQKGIGLIIRSLKQEMKELGESVDQQEHSTAMLSIPLDKSCLSQVLYNACWCKHFVVECLPDEAILMSQTHMTCNSRHQTESLERVLSADAESSAEPEQHVCLSDAAETHWVKQALLRADSTEQQIFCARVHSSYLCISSCTCLVQQPSLVSCATAKSLAGLSEQQVESMLEAQKPQVQPTIADEEEFPSLGMDPPQLPQNNAHSPAPVKPAAPAQVGSTCRVNGTSSNLEMTSKFTSHAVR